MKGLVNATKFHDVAKKSFVCSEPRLDETKESFHDVSRWNVAQDEAWELEELEGNKKFKVVTRPKKVWELKEIKKYEKIPTQKL